MTRQAGWLVGATLLFGCMATEALNGCSGGSSGSAGDAGTGASSSSGASGGSSCGAPEGPECNDGSVGWSVTNPRGCGEPGANAVTCFTREGSGALGAVRRGCVPEGNVCTGESFACGGSADCDAGQRCCADFAGGSVHARCKDACSGAEEVSLCDLDGDCAPGACAVYRCAERLVGSVKACARPAGCQ